MSNKADLNAIVTVRMPRWVAYELNDAAATKSKEIRRARERLSSKGRPSTDRALWYASRAAEQAMDAVSSALYNAE